MKSTNNKGDEMMIDSIIEFYKSSDIVPFFFWGPVVFNACVYPVHVWLRVQKNRSDVKKYIEDPKGYFSSYDFISVGSLFKYAFLTFIPVLNALATIFHAGPIAFDYLSGRFAWLFQLKLVNPKSAHDACEKK